MFHPVKAPQHYAGDGNISCMDALRSMMSNIKDMSPVVIYWWGCAFKYLWRWPLKGGKQDIEKCLQCIKYMRDEMEDGNGCESKA